MRPAELAFLVLMVLYHASLLVPRHRRAYALNYLIFPAGAALAWNLAMEGLRWQTLPPLALLFVDLAILIPTLARLRGRLPARGFWTALGGFGRSTLASIGFLISVACLVLAVAFPLPQVELTGGLPPSYRTVRVPAAEGRPGLELQIWYPAGADRRPLARPDALADAWARERDAGGLPVFWQAYREHLPSNLVRGGHLANAGTRFPVVFVAVPRGQNPADFGYQFEDLASRGLIVVAGTPLAPPRAAEPPFSWKAAWEEVTRPFVHPALWLEPEATWAAAPHGTDYRWLKATYQALALLDAEPGDVLFAAVDWNHLAVWAWGTGGASGADERFALGIRGFLHFGGLPDEDDRPTGREFWIYPADAGAAVPKGVWSLGVPKLVRADVADSAYLKPYLAFFGLKSQADAGYHTVLRQYQAAFFQFALWGSGDDGAFGQTVPEVPGLSLHGR